MRINRVRWVIGIAVVILIGWAAWAALRPQAAGNTVSANLLATNDAPPDASGFPVVTDPNGMTFPDAFGAHPEYQTEWWYYTGNLESEGNRLFGYQFTIFRRALTPDPVARGVAFAANDVYMAHFALTDAAAGNFYANERFQRGAAGAAGAVASPYHVWLDDWEVRENAPGDYHMRAVADEVSIEFNLRALKPPVRHGINGLSAKSLEVGNASYYYSQSRLETTGTLTVKGEAFTVSGLSWKDHEYGTSSLGDNAVGWDWFSLQLSDNTEVMLFQIRTDDGTIEPASSGSYILSDGTVQAIGVDDFSAQPLDTWTSPTTGGVYPVSWHLSLSNQQLDLTLTALIPNQELNLSSDYWEGSVRIEGTHKGEPITGGGYVELTGYTGAGVPSV